MFLLYLYHIGMSNLSWKLFNSFTNSSIHKLEPSVYYVPDTVHGARDRKMSNTLFGSQGVFILWGPQSRTSWR